MTPRSRAARASTYNRYSASSGALTLGAVGSSRTRWPRINPGLAVGLALLLVLVTISGYGLALVQRLRVPAWANTQPAIRSDFADPAILAADGAYYAYASNAGGEHIQVARSTDLRHWTLLPDALPVLPPWSTAAGAWVWAPDVIEIGARFVLYYTAQDAASGRQCVGVATSDTPAGPFHDAGAVPFVCQLDLGGTIDPSPFRDGDALYLYFKSDSNCCRMPTHIWGQRLTPDGMGLSGPAVALISNDQPWEGDVVEAPNMLKHDEMYDLFYSGNDYASDRYAVGYARCLSPLGPCSKTTDSPILASDPSAPAPLAGPGGASLVQANGSTWIAFHAWGVTERGSLGESRYLLIDRLGWRGERPVVLAPSEASP